MTDMTVIYLFDPLCGWCYGAAPMLDKLLANGVQVEALPMGLFSGSGARVLDDGFAAHAWSNDQRIARLSGQKFTKAYVEKVLKARDSVVDSGPATLGIVIAGMADETRRLEALKVIQRARYVDGRDIVTTDGVAAVLADAGMGAAAERLKSPDDDALTQHRNLVDRGRNLFRRLNANGVPSLVVEEAEGARLIGADALFGSLDNLIARLTPSKEQL